jgi:hypothetical protein
MNVNTPPPPSDFDTRLERFLSELGALEARNNRTDSDYEARFWIRPEHGRKYTAVFECCEFRHAGYRETLRSNFGDGHIKCFVDRDTGDVFAPKGGQRGGKGRPDPACIMGNIFNADHRLGPMGRVNLISEHDQGLLRQESKLRLELSNAELEEKPHSQRSRTEPQ